MKFENDWGKSELTPALSPILMTVVQAGWQLPVAREDLCDSSRGEADTKANTSYAILSWRSTTIRRGEEEN